MRISVKFCTLLFKIVQFFLGSHLGNQIIGKLAFLMQEIRKQKLQSDLNFCGERVKFQFPIYIAQSNQVEIGDDVSIASYVHIWGAGGVRIGNRVMIGSHTAISSVTHDYNQTNMYATVITKSIIIEDDVWIGTHAVIMPGVTIGKGAVVGAGCIVTKDIAPFTIVAGVPGRVLKRRSM